MSTSDRADYAPLSPLLHELKHRSAVQPQVIVSGSHLAPDFGDTYRALIDDGFDIDARVECLLASDTPTGMAKSLGLGIIGVADALQRLDPEIVVVLGDRYDSFGVALAAFLAGHPIAHIGGGQITSGVLDDAMRHALSKLASLHFTSAETFRRRLLQLGEDPTRVFNVGALSLDAILPTPILSRAELEEILGLRLRRPTLLVTYHPTIGDGLAPTEAADTLLQALSELEEASIVITGPNPDAGGRAIAQSFEAFARANSRRVRFVRSLGSRRYLSVLREADAVVGNSSSGLIEAPAVGTPTVNIGARQEGRPRAASVLDVPLDSKQVLSALQAVFDTGFQDRMRGLSSPYGAGGAAVRIADVLERVSLEGLAVKRFHDMPLEW